MMRTRPIRLLMLLVALPILAGCANRISSPAPRIEVSSARFCVLYKPVYWAQGDTEKTIEQVKENNAKWTALCQKK